MLSRRRGRVSRWPKTTFPRVDTSKNLPDGNSGVSKLRGLPSAGGHVRGVFGGVQLEADIRAFVDAHNANPKPFRWTKSADDILAAIQRFCTRTMQIGGTTESGH